MIFDPNHWLSTFYRLDPFAFQPLLSYQGQIFSLCLSEAEKTYYFCITENGFKLISSCEEDCTLRITATVASLLQLVMKKPPLSQLNIRIQGDDRFGQVLMECLSRYQGRPSDLLAEKLGEKPIHFAKHLLKKAYNHFKPPAVAVYDQSMDYVVYEAELVAPKAAVDDFNHAVDTLVLDTERLEAKINFLLTHAKE